MTAHTADTGDGLKLRVRTDGPVGTGRPLTPLLLCNSLGTDLSMWDPQVPAWSRDRQVVRFNHRGSTAGPDGTTVPPQPYSVDRLGTDAIRVLDHLGVAVADICGLSLGGLVAQWILVHHPDRVRRAVLADTAPRIGTPDGWEARIAAVADTGTDGIADMVLTRFFSPAFRAAGSPHLHAVRAMVVATPDEGYAGACAALAAADLSDDLARIAAPTLVLVGGADEATPPEQSEALARGLADSRLEVLPGAGHLANLEQPETFAALVQAFLDGVG